MTLPRRWAHGAWRGGALGGAGLGAGFGLLLDEAEHVFSPEHMVAANLLGRQAAVLDVAPDRGRINVQHPSCFTDRDLHVVLLLFHGAEHTPLLSSLTRKTACKTTPVLLKWNYARRIARLGGALLRNTPRATRCAGGVGQTVTQVRYPRVRRF
jgi:hypothetical protein